MEDGSRVRAATNQYLIEFEESLFVCVFKDFATDKFGLNFTAPSEIFGCLLEDAPIAGMAAGGCLSKDNAKELVRFLQDFIEGKI